MMQIPPEFILKTLKNAYEKYDTFTDKDEVKALKTYGFCDGLEKIIYKFSPEFTKDLKQMRAQSKISEVDSNNSSINLEEPTWLRNKIFN